MRLCRRAVAVRRHSDAVHRGASTARRTRLL